MDEGQRRAGWIFTLAVIIGGLFAAFLDLVLFMYDDSCPQWEDEGTMAAPGSLYSQVMCSPGTEIRTSIRCGSPADSGHSSTTAVPPPTGCPSARGESAPTSGMPSGR